MSIRIVIGLLVLFCLSMPNRMQANVLRLGPRVEGHFSKVVLKQGIPYLRKFSLSVGLVGRVTLLFCYLQPGLLFSITRFACRKAVSTKAVKCYFNTIDVPIIVGLYLGILRIQGGLVYNWVLQAKEGDWVQKDHKSATLGYQVGGGIDLGKWMIDLTYTGGLTRLGDMLCGITNYRAKHYSLSVGYSLW